MNSREELKLASMWQERAPQGPWFVETPHDGHIFFGSDTDSAKQCMDAINRHAQRPLWRDDMENAPKDRPFLVYWRLSKIYGVVEWNKDHWEDQAGDKVLAFRNWREFELYAVTSTECGGEK